MTASIAKLKEIADAKNELLHYTLAKYNSKAIKNEENWPELTPIDNSQFMPEVDLLNNQRSNIMTRLAISTAENILFPKSTALLHSYGVVASLLTRCFSIDYGFEHIPVNLYVVSGQPPSTGKSGVNNRFMQPVIEAYKELNKQNDRDRRRLNGEIKRYENELEALYKKSYDEYEEQELVDKLEHATEQLEKIPFWRPTLTDVTIESAEKTAASQQGMFNIVSAEANAVKVVTGGVYGADKGGSGGNNGLLLQAWDGEYISVGRVGREGYTGVIRATIAVLAQEVSVDAILNAGANGDGLAERFLFINEPSLLGHRSDMSRTKFDVNLHNEYKQLVYNIINEKDDVLLKLSPDADVYLRHLNKKIEPEMSEDGKYQNDLLTGFMGKADKHIKKLAAVLHCVEHWAEGGKRSREITQDTVAWAAFLFKELSKTYIFAADKHGYTGVTSEIDKLVELFTGYAEKNKLKITVQTLRSNIHKVKPFRGTRNLTARLKDKLLPTLVEHNYIVLSGSTIFINPRLR